MVIEVTKIKKLGFVNIVSTNTFFIPMKNCPKVTLIWILTVHKMLLRGRVTKFSGTYFWRGQDFWAVNLRGAKSFKPSL